MITLTSDYQYLGRSSGMAAKSGYATYYLLLYGKVVPNKDTGVHKVYVKFYIASDKNSTFYWYPTEYNGKINNTQVFGSSTDKEPRDAWELSYFKAGDVTYNKATLIKEGSLDIDCSDGLSKNIPLSAYWKIVNDNGDTYVPASGTNRTVSATVTLPAIPRATTLDSFSGNKRIGVSDDVIINFTKKNASFTTTLEYATIADFSDAVTIVDKSANANTYSWTIPISLLNKIPNSKTLPIYIRLTTYSGNTQIGNAQTSSFDSIVYEDNCRPVWNTHTIEETDATAKQLVTTANKFIANLSKPKFTFSATGQYGATIKYYQVNNTTRTSGFTDSAFNINGYTLKVVDSRGIENTYKFDLTYVPYFTPIFEEVKLFRDVPTSEKLFSYFKVKFFNNTSSVKFDNPQALSYKFNYQESGGTAQEKTITPETYDDGTSRYAENETELGNTFNYKKSVDWTFSFVDLTGKTFTTNATLTMGIPLMNGKMEGDDQVLYINGDIKGEGAEHILTVSSTEPKNKTAVWLQKSKNLFDKSKIQNHTGTFTQIDNGFIVHGTANETKAVVYHDRLPKGNYSVSGDIVGCDNFIELYIDSQYISGLRPNSNNQFTLTQESNIMLFFYGSVSWSSVADTSYTNIQIEEGTVVTEYNPYIKDRKIYTKNGDGSYSEFIPNNLEEAMQENEVYSKSEVRIGTFLGKPLYRRVIHLQNIDLGSANEYAIHDISNYEVVFVPKYYIYNAADINGLRFKMVESTCYEVSANSYMHILAFQNNLLYQSNMWKYIEYGYVVIEYTKTTD